MKTKKLLFILPFLIFGGVLHTVAQSQTDSMMQVKGLSIAAPKPATVDRFVKFIDNELAPRKANTLVLRVDWNYQYQSHPELRDSSALSKEQVKKMVEVCDENDIRLIPQLNLVGHQSWAGNLGKLLEEYPEFDETPHIEMPDEYEWPNEDGLYCKSYCTRHPEVHDVVFDLVDELVTVFEADAFHAGMDEVFYIGNDSCSRCAGRDKAKLFADEVRRIRNHLKESGTEMWIWGDRLLDGKTTGLGMWEASMNNTHRAIDMIPKDVVICDWHYAQAVPTHVYFATKGFNVISCSWNKPAVAVQQLQSVMENRFYSNATMQKRLKGVMHTVWSPCKTFLDEFEAQEEKSGEVKCFNALFDKIKHVD